MGSRRELKDAFAIITDKGRILVVRQYSDVEQYVDHTGAVHERETIRHLELSDGSPVIMNGNEYLIPPRVMRQTIRAFRVYENLETLDYV